MTSDAILSTENQRGRKRKKQAQQEEKREWDNGAPAGDADAILEGIRSWYEDRFDGQHVSVAWEYLKRCLFRSVTVPVDADVRRKPHLGAPQPGDNSKGQGMSVSKEHVARQVREVITWREKWFAQQMLPMSTLVNNEQKEAFLKASKDEYHSRPDQTELQQRDAEEGGAKLVRSRKKSRWARNLQRLAGSAHMWYVLSFTGKFDPAFFDDLPPPLPPPDEPTEEQRQNTKRAVEARAKL